jgi:hypothetical protein
VCVPIVLDHTNVLGLWILWLHQCSHTTSGILAGASCGNLHVPPASQGLTHHALSADALPFLLIVHACWVAWPGPLRRPHLTTQWLAGFVAPDHRRARIIGQLGRLDAICHAPDAGGIGMRWDTPRCDDPWLHSVFLNAGRTVSGLIVSTSPKTTSASASRCKVQWHRPWGGSLQATCTHCCAISPWIVIVSGRGGWGLG